MLTVSLLAAGVARAMRLDWRRGTGAVLLSGIGSVAWAQGLVAPVGLAAPVGIAAPAGIVAPVGIKPVEVYGSINEILTSNYLLSSVNPESDAITRPTIGVRLNGQSGLIRGYLDYSLSSLLYARHSRSNGLQNALSADLSADLAEGRAKIAAAASISQSAVSAFGAQPVNGLPNANSTELRSYRLTPSFLGPLGRNFRYTASLGYGITQSSASQAGDSSFTNGALHIEQVSTGRLGLSADATHTGSSYNAGRATSSDRFTVALNLLVSELDLRTHVNGGVELTDIGSLSRQRYRTWGAGGEWTPSPRTSLRAQYDDRFFGNSHSLSFEYRTALTVWRVSDSRSLSSDNGQLGIGGRGTAFDLFYAQFASIEPDPVKRTSLVTSYLLSRGIDPTTGLTPSFLRAAVTVDDRKEVSVAWRGQRNSAILAVNRTQSQRVDSPSTAVDNLTQSTAISLQGLSLNLTHQLTPVASVSLGLNESHGYGNLANQDSRQRQANLQYSTTLARAASLVVGLRRGLYTTSQSPYNETALFATFGTRF